MSRQFDLIRFLLNRNWGGSSLFLTLLMHWGKTVSKVENKEIPSPPWRRDIFLWIRVSWNWHYRPFVPYNFSLNVLSWSLENAHQQPWSIPRRGLLLFSALAESIKAICRWSILRQTWSLPAESHCFPGFESWRRWLWMTNYLTFVL